MFAVTIVLSENRPSACDTHSSPDRFGVKLSAPYAPMTFAPPKSPYSAPTSQRRAA